MAGQNGSSAAEALYLHELRGDGFKRLKHFAVKLNKGVTPVTGKNGAGKSTFLDAIKHLLADAKHHSAEVIRRGEEQCQLMGVLSAGPDDPKFIVERRWRKTEKGELQTVVLKAADGTRLPSPQAVLDSFFNTFTFDPLAFMRLEPKKQLEELKKLIGVNTGPLDGKRADLYELRTDVNKKRTDRGARLKAMPTPPAELPAEPVNVDELLKQQNELQTVRLRNESQRRDLRDAEREYSNLEKSRDAANVRVSMARETLEEAKRQLVKAESDLERIDGILKEASLALEERRVSIEQLQDPNVGDLVTKISAAQTTNLWIDRRKQREQLEAELKKLDQEEAELTAAIAAIDAEKQKLIAEAKFPVAGLGFGAEGVLLNSFPLEQASAAEKMRVSTAIGFKQHPRLKTLAIHDGSLLDDDSLVLLEQLCAEQGGQLLIERVGAEADVGILIEDGEVVPVRAVGKGQQDLGIVVEGRQP